MVLAIGFFFGVRAGCGMAEKAAPPPIETEEPSPPERPRVADVRKPIELKPPTPNPEPVFPDPAEPPPPPQPRTVTRKRPSAPAVPPISGRIETPTPPSRETAPPPRELPIPPTIGVLVLKNSVPVGKGVSAWIELNGQRTAEWPPGESQVRLELKPAQYKVTVRAVVQGVRKLVYTADITVRVQKKVVVTVG